MTSYDDVSRVVRFQTSDDVQKCALSTARRPDYSDEFALSYREVDAIKYAKHFLLSSNVCGMALSQPLHIKNYAVFLIGAKIGN